MNNEKMNQIIDDAYKYWCKQFEVDPNNFNGEEVDKGHNDQCWGYPLLENTSKEYKRGQINAYLEGKADKPFFYLTQEEFINKIKTNDEFAKKWDLKIEERELSDVERVKLFFDKFAKEGLSKILNGKIQKYDIPTKLITITYNNIITEVYE